MNFDIKLVELITAELKKELPGESAQYRMAPSYRPHLDMEEILKHEPRLGGVMLLLYEKQGELHIVFTQRKQYDGVHSGQMSLPGGKKDSGDNDMVATALRETKEEVGIDKEHIKVLGKLSELYIPPSNFLVYPVVGFAERIDSFYPQKEEVEQIVEIPVSFFLDKANVNLNTEIRLFNGTVVHVPAYIFGQHIIWGATAIILSEFVFILERLNK